MKHKYLYKYIYVDFKRRRKKAETNRTKCVRTIEQHKRAKNTHTWNQRKRDRHTIATYANYTYAVLIHFAHVFRTHKRSTQQYNVIINNQMLYSITTSFHIIIMRVFASLFSLSMLSASFFPAVACQLPMNEKEKQLTI